MQIVILLLISILFFMIYMLIRNMWVFKRHENWNNLVYNYRIGLLNNNDNEAYCKYSYSELFDAISPYNKIFFIFWEWRLSRFIEDQNKFNLVMKGIKK